MHPQIRIVGTLVCTLGLLASLASCATGPPEVDVVEPAAGLADETPELAYLFAADPALFLRIDGRRGVEELGHRLATDDPGTDDWSWTGIGGITHRLLDAGIDGDESKPVWGVVSRTPFAAMNRQIDVGFPITAPTWPTGLHLRLLLPGDGGSLDAGDVAPADGELTVELETRDLGDYLLVDALIVDREIGEQRRTDWIDELRKSDSGAQDLDATPALAQFFEADASLALYGRLDTIGEVTAGLTALDARRHLIDDPSAGIRPDGAGSVGRGGDAVVAFGTADELADDEDIQEESEATPDGETIESADLARWWFETSHRAFQARQRIDDPTNRAGDIAVFFDSGDDGDTLRVTTTPTANAPDQRTSDEAITLPEPVDGEAIFSADIAEDLDRILRDRTLPSWALDRDDRISFDAVLKGVDAPIDGLFQTAGNPTPLIQALIADHFDGRAPTAVRVRAYADGGFDHSIPHLPGPVAIAARFYDDGTIISDLHRRLRPLRDAGWKVDSAFSDGGDGSIDVSIGIGAPVDELFDETRSAVDSTRVTIDTPLFQGLDGDDIETTGELVPGLSVLHQYFDGIRHPIHLEIPRTDTPKTLRFSAGGDTPPLTVASGEFDERIPATSPSCLEAQAPTIYRKSPPIDDRTASCEARGDLSEDDGRYLRSQLHWFNGQYALLLGSQSGAERAFETSCEMGHDMACRAAKRIQWDDDIADGIPQFDWPGAPPHNKDCAGSVMLSIDPYGVAVDGEPVADVVPSEDGDGVSRVAKHLIEAIEDTDQVGPEALFDGIPGVVESQRRQITVAAAPDVDTRFVLESLQQVDASESAGPIDVHAIQEARAVSRSRASRVSCAPFRLGSGDMEHAESRLAVTVDAKGFDLTAGDENLSPALRCPEAGPTICLRSDQVGIPPDRWIGFDALPMAAREYDIRKLNRRLHTVDAWHRGEMPASIRVDAGVPWAAFLAVNDTLRLPDRPIGEFEELPEMREFVRFDVLDPHRGTVETDRTFHRGLTDEMRGEFEELQRSRHEARDIEVTTR